MNALRQRLRAAYNAERKRPQPLSASWSANRKANEARIAPLVAQIKRERGLI